eukprot:scaffold291_cov332-Pavlova_lutheri.AAC.7
MHGLTGWQETMSPSITIGESARAERNGWQIQRLGGMVVQVQRRIRSDGSDRRWSTSSLS